MLWRLWKWWRSLWESGEQRAFREHCELMDIEGEGSTLTGLRKLLRYQNIHRAKIYEARFLLVLVVPPGTWPDLQKVLRGEWVPLTCQVAVFPTLSWWECWWGGIQIFSKVGEEIQTYNPGSGRVE